jgi:hypothetical protein
MQSRSITGIQFEKSFTSSGWVRSSLSPRLAWTGRGRSNIEKIISLDYDHTNFVLLGASRYQKWDLYNPTTFKYREVKKYYISQVFNWTLYSEPYFKVASESQFDLVDPIRYNEFTRNFYQMHTKSGLFTDIQERMIETIEGIQFIDAFVPKKHLEFRTVLLEGWMGCNRITIQFKIK